MNKEVSEALQRCNSKLSKSSLDAWFRTAYVHGFHSVSATLPLRSLGGSCDSLPSAIPRTTQQATACERTRSRGRAGQASRATPGGKTTKKPATPTCRANLSDAFEKVADTGPAVSPYHKKPRVSSPAVEELICCTVVCVCVCV